MSPITWSSTISLIGVLAVMFMVGCLVATSKLPRMVKWVTYWGLAFRVIGAIARYEVLFIVYNGVGDARGYFGKGLVLAGMWKNLDFSSLMLDLQGGRFVGTQFVRNASAFVLVFIGDAMFTEFVVFSLFAFSGLAGFGVAFSRTYPDAPLHRYLIWIFFFPSLWYWPGSVGKEALILMGLGLAVMGFVGRQGRVQWHWLILGATLTFLARPQVTGVLLVSIMLAQWFAFDGRWTARRVTQSALILAIGMTGVVYTMRQIGVDEMDVEGVAEYVETDSAKSAGNTSVDPVSLSPTGIPMAAINILFRPLPWEVTNSMVALSSMEIMTLWAIVFYRRRNLLRSLKYWRTDRYLRLSLAFALIYSIGLGLMVVNVGIIARQRIFLFPFIFMLIEADPRSTAPRESARPAFSAVGRRRLPPRAVGS
ncbi:MAG TPA: hypothetical protein VMN39_10765 [Longimicrobiaceae bacterium]|nr:hypothetical protein [Longimicrobiaceae bacterium]